MTYTRGFRAAFAALLLLIAVCAVSGCSKEEEVEPSVSVTSKDVTAITDLKGDGKTLSQSASYSLPKNSFVKIDASDLAVVRSKTDLPHPLEKVGVFDLSSGNYTEVLPQGVSHDEGYDIYDARATDTMLLWVETKATTEQWRLYRAPLAGGSLGDPVLLATGDSTRQIPAISAFGQTAIWVDALNLDLREGGETTHVYKTDTDAKGKTALFTTTNPIRVAPQRSDGILTVCDWASAGSSRRSELHAIDIATGEEKAILRLPSPISVSDAIYLDTGFSFSVPALYEGSGPLGNVGTYVQTGESTFVRFQKTPMDTPSKIASNYLVKNGASNIYFRPETNNYSVIAPPDNAPDYGDYNAAQGAFDKVVLYTQTVDESGASGPTTVRIFSP